MLSMFLILMGCLNTASAGACGLYTLIGTLNRTKGTCFFEVNTGSQNVKRFELDRCPGWRSDLVEPTALLRIRGRFSGRQAANGAPIFLPDYEVIPKLALLKTSLDSIVLVKREPCDDK